MNNDSYNKNRSFSNKKINDKSTDRLKQRASMILGPSFDIKKYLNKVNSQYSSTKREKYDFPPLFDRLYKRTKIEDKRYELTTIANENLPSHIKNILQKNKPSSIDISTTISYNNNSITIKNNKNSRYTLNSINGSNKSMIYDKLKLSKNKSSKTYIETESNSRSLDLYKNSMLNNSEKYNFAKTIKSIKKFIELSRRDKSIKNIMDNRIAYDPQNSNEVFKPIRIMNDFSNFQQHELNKKKDNISLFLTDNREISRRNVIIKLLQNQKKDFSDNSYDYEKSLDNQRKTIDYDENIFSSYITNQKLLCRKIDDLLIKLTLSNRRLYHEYQKLKEDARVKQDERQKFLERIDELRIVAKFVTKVLGGNVNIFKKQIIPEYSSEHLPNYEKITKDVLARYNFLLDEEEREDSKEDMKEDELNVIKEINHLNDPELLYQQYHQIEYDIINTLKNKKAIEEETVEIKKEGRKQCNDILKRIDKLEKELDMYKSIYKREENDYEEIYKRNYVGDNELDDAIKDLYDEVMYLENYKIPTKKSKVSITWAILDVKKLITNKEEKINKLQIILEQQEKENKHLFDRIACNRRNDNKELKVNIMKKIIAADQKEKIDQIKLPEKKIIFIKRKAEPPYQPPKKEKKIKIDPEIIKQIENEELLTYE